VTRAAATGSGRQLEASTVAAGGEDGDVIRRLQNGPDVRGVALEGEKGRPVDLTPLAVEVIGESFGEWLREKGEGEEDGQRQQLRVSVGRDPRLSGSRLSAVLFAGLARAGCAVFDMGLATTPACFMSTILPRFDYDASIMVRLTRALLFSSIVLQ
jgi:phosphomannomutase